MVLQEHQDLQEQVVLVVHLDLQDQVDQVGLVEHLELMVHLVVLVLVDLLALLDLQEHLKFTRTDEDSNAIRYGYSAQQVQSVLPDAVSGDEKLSVNYMDVHTLKIAALEKRIAELEAKLK